MPLERLDVHERSITNRSRELTMDRRWVQARSIHWSPYDPVGVVNAVP
jgi:hypothetical protein